MAERAASHRERLNEEILMLCDALRSAAYELLAHGNHNHLGWMFWSSWEKALDAIRRYKPELATDLAEVEARSKAYVLNMREQRMNPHPPEGPKRGSILVGGSVFSMDTRGRVLRDGKRTEFQVFPKTAWWMLIEEKSENKYRKVRENLLPRPGDGLFAAATIIVEREKGGPLATICPDLDTYQTRGQRFSMPPDSGPPAVTARSAMAAGTAEAASQAGVEPVPQGSGSVTAAATEPSAPERQGGQKSARSRKKPGAAATQAPEPRIWKVR